MCPDSPTAQLCLRQIFAPCRDHDRLPQRAKYTPAAATRGFFYFDYVRRSPFPLVRMWDVPVWIQDAPSSGAARFVFISFLSSLTLMISPYILHALRLRAFHPVLLQRRPQYTSGSVTIGISGMRASLSGRPCHTLAPGFSVNVPNSVTRPPPPPPHVLPSPARLPARSTFSSSAYVLRLPQYRSPTFSSAPLPFILANNQ
ncbi:hypothetical protein DFH09DRAFT_1331904 [Mycena vulgaris]|nr:hypothetical protein DFH09DRAFT_1331904 [Mycena vulgaris]